MTSERKKVVIIGAGITGLTAAYYIQKEANEINQPIQIEILESSLRVGGKINTIRKDGYVIEKGPESFLDASNSMRDLARDLQIEHEMMKHRDGDFYICAGKHLHKLPSSFILGGSAEVTPLATTGLISLVGKVRACGDLFIGKSKNKQDESIGDFFTRRFGKEVVENLVEPILAGTLAGDIDHLSMNAMFPRFYELEKSHRSLIFGLLATQYGFLNANTIKPQVHYETFRNGLLTLIEELQNALSPHAIKMGYKVKRLEPLKNGKTAIYLDNKDKIDADAVIVTTPFHVTKTFMPEVMEEVQTAALRSASIATVSMAFKTEDIEKYKKVINIFTSRNSDTAITSCTFATNKWDNVAPDGHELLRVYIGRVGDETIVELADQEIEKTVLNDLNMMLGLTAKPLFTIVSRWQQGMPQYSVGHEGRLKELKNQLSKSYPNVTLAGSSFEGISMPKCVRQGKSAAHEIIKKINKDL